MPTVRTFIAVESSPEVRAAAARLTESLTSQAQVKWVAPDNLHFTLQFLGDVETERIAEIGQAVERAAARHSTFEIEVRGAGAFPTPQRARTVWLGVGHGAEAMQRLQGDIERELKKLGFRPEGRDFTPHLTLGRVRSLPHGDDLPQRISQERDFAAGVMPVAEVVVFSSQLGPKGSTYTALCRAPLGKSPPSG